MPDGEDWSRGATRTQPPVDASSNDARSGSVGTRSRQRSTVSSGRGGRGGRRARLMVRRFDPWSVLKFAFVLAIVIFVIWIVAIAVLYGLLAGAGVFDRLNNLISSFAGSGHSGLPTIFTAKNVIGVAAALGGVEVILFTALTTLGAFIYNLCADLVGGVEVTLTERE